MAKEPEQIELSPQEIEALHERIKNFTVTKEDMVMFGKVLDFFVWMQMKLQKCQLTINKLKKIIFGGTEKSNRSRSKQNDKDGKEDKDGAKAPAQDTPNICSPEGPSAASEETSSSDAKNERAQVDNPPSGKSKGHGRIGADEYHPDETIRVQHAALKPGDACQTECGGKLYGVVTENRRYFRHFLYRTSLDFHANNSTNRLVKNLPIVA